MSDKTTQVECQPIGTQKVFRYHWLQFLDHEPEPWVWSHEFNNWLHFPWYYKSAPDKPNGGWRYIGPAYPPVQMMNTPIADAMEKNDAPK